MSLDWRPDPEEATGPGEVYDTPRSFNRRRANPLALGTHICGTEEQWAGRAKYNPDVNVEYNNDGLPLCCGVLEEPGGGLLLGGAAVVGYTPPPAPSCATAQHFATGTPFVVNDPLPIQWYKTTLTSAGEYWRFVLSSDSPSTYATVYEGPCEALSGIVFLIGSGCASFYVNPADLDIRIQVFANGATTYTLTLEPGTCPP